MFRYYLLLFFMGCVHGYASGQTAVIDQLKKAVETATDPAVKLKAVFNLCEQRQSLHTDTLCKYASFARQLSLRQNNQADHALADYYLASCLVKRGLLDSAYTLCTETILKTNELPGAVDAMMRLTGLKAQILTRSSRYKEGLAEFYKVLNTAQKHNDILMQMGAKNGIGWVNMEMDQPTEALRWFFSALKTTDNKLRHEKNSNIYSNIAAVYKQLNQNDSADYYIRIAIDFSRRIENLFSETASTSSQILILIRKARCCRSSFKRSPRHSQTDRGSFLYCFGYEPNGRVLCKYQRHG
ncbi:MAG: hypothetical protein WKF88_12085 [Ferruginibacter sp.]